MNLPTLSVLIPNYNHARYLPESLESVLQQSVQPLEIIVVDDASKDNSIEVLEEFSRKHPLVKFYRNETNRGVAATLNRGVELARGDYVFLPGADDRTLPGYFEKSLTQLALHPEAGLCFPNPASFDHATGKIKQNQLGLSETACYLTPEKLVELSRRKRVQITGGAVMKRSAVLAAGGFLPELRWHCDSFLTCVISFRQGACYLPEALYLWRATPQSYMTSGLRQWGTQWAVLNHLMDRLHSPEYRDVLPYFQKSSVLGANPRTTFLILSKRKYWPFFNWPLVKTAVPMDIFWSLPHWLQRILRKILAQ